MAQLAIKQALDLAMQHQGAGRFNEAEQIYRQILNFQPGHFYAMHNLGLIARQTKRHDLAVNLLGQAVAIEPQVPEAHYNLGIALGEQGRLDDAVAAYQRAIALKPDLSQAHNNLGYALTELGRYPEAMAALQRATSLDSRNPEAWTNLGRVLHEMGELDQAIAAHRRALALKPNDPQIHWNLALALLASGQFAEGWEEFEWRLKLTSMNLDRNFPQPYWNGQDISGQRLLVYTEGGFGEALCFIRLLPLISGMAGQVIVECQRDLMRLFADVPGVERWVARGEALPAFDCRISLVSLPKLLGIRLESIPNSVPYLRAPGNVARSGVARVAEDGMKNIGLCWAGSSGGVRHRSRHISLFAPLAKVMGVRFFSLQKGQEGNQSPPDGMQIINHTRELNDFADTAALIQNLDLVISVDTSIVHLAGALAKPVWVLIPFAPDWRWMSGREDSPWYPTMRLFRQRDREDWGGVMARVADELSVWVENCR
jgi:Flp pilus assembly protein TadD